MKAMTKYTFINSSPALTGRQMVTRLSSFGKEEYPKGEVVGENASLPTTPSLRATPPSRRRGAEIASRCTLFSVLCTPFSVLCTLFSVLCTLSSCDSERIEPSMSGEAITATAEMPKNLATLTRAMPQAATGLTLHYTAAKTNELAECTVPDENITGNSIDGTFSFTTSWGSENAAENLLWGQVAKEDNCTFYLTAESNDGVPMWATATAAHGSEIAFGQMAYRKAAFWLVVESEHNFEEYPTFTATMKVVPAAETADVTQLEWPTTGGAAETVNIEDGVCFYLAPQTLADATLTIEAEEYNKTWTLDLSTVDVLNQDGSATGRKANEFPAGQSLTLTVRLSLTQLDKPGSIEITDFTAAATTDYTAELGGTTNPGYTISADGKTYTVTNRYGLQAWLDAYAKDNTLEIVVDFPTENVDLTLPEAFATDTTWPVSGNTWAGKTWRNIVYVDSDGNITLDAANLNALDFATQAAYDRGVSLVLTGDNITGKVYFDSSIAPAGSIDLILPDATALPEDAFNSCPILRSVSAPKVETVGQQAFQACTGLAGIELPAATEIGQSAFAKCTNLKSVNLPKATTIGMSAFANCTGLTTVTLQAATSIGNNAFYSCTGLTGISLPAATSIASSAFYYCTALSSVNLPAATEIVHSAFNGCTSLTGIELPAATSIGQSAFANCTALSSVNLPVATTIGKEAFGGCTGLTGIELPAATSIGQSAFYYCTALSSVNLPVATTIGKEAFNGCTGLTSVTFGSVVTSVGSSPFNNASTSTCTLTLNPGQADSTDYPAEEGENKEWAGNTWQEIKFSTQ